MTAALKYYIGPEYKLHSEVIAAALENLIAVAGWQSLRVYNMADAHLTYGARTASAFALPCIGPEAFSSLAKSSPLLLGGIVIPSKACVNTPGAPAAADYAAAAHFYLCGMHEAQASDLNFAAVPGASLKKWDIGKAPALSLLASRLQSDICASVKNPPAPRPAWPDNKSWALCITHDLDHVFKYRPAGYMRDGWNALKVSAMLAAGSCAAKAFYSAGARLFGTDPFLLAIKNWIVFERCAGLRACYFMPVTHRCENGADNAHDPTAAANLPELKTLASQVLDMGGELALHTSINAWKTGDAFSLEIQKFSKLFGMRPKGFRAHYLSLNPRNETETFQFAAREGLVYDSSCGLSRTVGFRRHMAGPYRPYSLPEGKDSGLWELPITAMDCGLSSENAEAPLSVLEQLAAAVKAVNGAMVLDWHPNVFFDRVSQDMRRFAELAAADSACWIATPAEIADWQSTGRWH